MSLPSPQRQTVVPLPTEFIRIHLPRITSIVELKVSLHLYGLITSQTTRPRRVSWDALTSVIPLDDEENCVAQGETLTIQSHGNIIYSERLVALIGVDDLAIIDTPDALLIGHKAQMQKVKDVVERLRAQGRAELL